MLNKDLRLLPGVLFMMAVFILTMNWILGSKDKPRFHEIVWDSRAIVSGIVDSAEKAQDFDTTTSSDTVTLAARKQNRKALAGIQQKIEGLNDSSWKAYVKPRLFIARESSALGDFDIDSLLNTRDTAIYLKNVEVVLTDTAYPFRQIKHNTSLPVKVYKFSDHFMSKYPLFGTWALLLIIQILLYSIFIPALVYILFKVSPIEAVKKLRVNNGVRLLYIIGFIGSCWAFYYFLLESDGEAIVKHQYFMAALPFVFVVANSLGYLTAGLCLTGMIFCFIETVKANDAKIKDQEVAEFYTGRLQLYFASAAIILSLAVFASGSLFSALNSLDFVQQVSIAKGYPSVRTDFVYLYGFIHTFLLLLFYVPARYQLNQLRRAAMPTAQAQDWTFMKKLAEIAVVGSPLLAGLLQSLVDFSSQ